MTSSTLCPPVTRETARSIAVASLVLGVAVALGAFGAHGLKETLLARGRMEAWNSAVLYHLVHGVALLVIGVWTRLDPAAAASRAVRSAARLWLAGIVFFSGSLYTLGLGAPTWVGPITPVGGVCFLIGWIALATAAWRGLGNRP